MKKQGPMNTAMFEQVVFIYSKLILENLLNK